MSEYQYYEFQAVDRRLTESEMRALRSLSSRASITPTSFTNEYNFGNFRGSPETLMARYFDAHLYLANWGSHRLMLRVPRRLCDEKTAAQYCAGRLAEAKRHGQFVVFDFNAEEDSGDGDWEEAGPWLASLISIRADLLRGDLRALYLGWLLCVQGGDVDEGALEPPVPPGLGKLSAALERFCEFLRIDPALVEVAAEGQPAQPATAKGSRKSVVAAIDALPAAKKNEYLRRLAEEDDPHLRAELLRHLDGDRPKSIRDRGAQDGRRTAGALLAAARARADENRQKEADRQAKAHALAEKKAAQARRRRIASLRKDEPAAWRRVDVLIAAAEPSSYDRAVKLLADLRDLAVHEGKPDEFVARLNSIRMQHKTKGALLRRINAAGLRSPTVLA